MGGAGGLGSIVIQLAKLAGLKVVASASREESADFVRKMGADAVVNHKKDLVEEIKLQNINEVDYIYSTVALNKKNLETYANITKPLGHILTVLGPEEDLNLNPVFLKRISIHHEWMGTRPHFNVEPEI